MNEPLKRSACQARERLARICGRASPARRRRPPSSRSRALPPTATEPNRNRWPVSRSFSRRASSTRAAKRLRAGGQADAGADRADVVEVCSRRARARAGSSGPARARAAARDRAPPRTRCAYATALLTQQPAHARATTGSPSASASPSAASLEATVLVEEPHVDVQDQVADDVEPEVARLDHAGVDRPDRDLVGVGAVHGCHEPRLRSDVVVDERPERLVPVEADRRRDRAPPARPSRRPGARSTIVGTAPSVDAAGLEPWRRRPRAVRSVRTTDPLTAARVETREPPAVGERSARSSSRYVARRSARSPEPSRRAPSTSAESGSAERGDGEEREQQRHGDRGQRQRRAADRVRDAARAARALVRPRVSTSACARPRKPSASRIAAAPRSPGPTRPGSRRRRSAPRSRRAATGEAPASVPSDSPTVSAERGLVRADAADRVPAPREIVREERRRRVEAERLRDRVPDDVDDHVLRARAGRRSRRRARSRPCARGSSRRAAASTPSLARETAPRLRARRGRSRRARPPVAPVPIVGASACCVRQATRSDRREQRGGEECGDRRRAPRSGRRAASCAPAPSRSWRRAPRRGARTRRAPSRGSRSICGRERHESASRLAAAARAGEHDDAEQRHAEPERREDEVLPAGLERPRLAAEPDEQGRGGRRRLDQRSRPHRGCPRAGLRAAPPRTRRSRPVGALARARAERRSHVRPRRIGGETSALARPTSGDHAEEQTAGRVDDDPAPDARTTRGSASGDDRERRPPPRRSRRRRPVPCRARPVAERARAASAIAVGMATVRAAMQLPLSHGGVLSAAVSPAPNSAKIRSWKTPATRATSSRSTSTPISITSDEVAGQRERREREPVLDERRSRAPGRASRVARRDGDEPDRDEGERGALGLRRVEAERRHQPDEGQREGDGRTRARERCRTRRAPAASLGCARREAEERREHDAAEHERRRRDGLGRRCVPRSSAAEREEQRLRGHEPHGDRAATDDDDAEPERDDGPGDEVRSLHGLHEPGDDRRAARPPRRRRSGGGRAGCASSRRASR